MISAPPDRCPTCSGAIIDDDGPVCIMCGHTPAGWERFARQGDTTETEGEETEKMDNGQELTSVVERHERVAEFYNRILAGECPTPAGKALGIRANERTELMALAPEEVCEAAKANNHRARQLSQVRMIAKKRERKTDKADGKAKAEKPLTATFTGANEQQTQTWTLVGTVKEHIEELGEFRPVAALRLSDLALLSPVDFDTFWGALGLLVRAKAKASN